MASRETTYELFRRSGVSRRDFLKYSTLLTATLGLDASFAPEVARALETKPRVPVLWLEFQDCAGCTESFTRSSSPLASDLVLNTISLDYHETLQAAAGFQAEAAKEATIKKYNGEYVLLVDGAVTPEEGGGYCTIGGKSNMDLLREAAAGAKAIIAVGTCSSFGGIQAAKPNPTGAIPVHEVIKDKAVVNVPGCPPIPAVITGTIMSVLVFGKIPDLDDLGRPKVFYGNTIHDKCYRRSFYDQGKFAKSFDDEGARKGYCLYELGCKGPTTYNACATVKWNDGLSFPIQSGHGCLGCSEPNFWDKGSFYQAISTPLGTAGTIALAAAGVGVAVGAGLALKARRDREKAAEASK